MKRKQNFFQKLLNSSVVSSLPYILGFLIAVLLNTVTIVQPSSTSSVSESFITALSISVGICSFIGFPAIVLMWITQALVKRFWKNSMGDKIFKFIRKFNRLFSSFILSTFISCLLSVFVRMFSMLPNDFWQPINPFIIPQSQWSAVHYCSILFFGIITILLTFLILISIFKATDKICRFLESQRSQMGSNQQILNISISLVRAISYTSVIIFIITFFTIGIGGIGWLIIYILPKTLLLEVPLFFWAIVLLLTSPVFLLIPKFARKKSSSNQTETQQTIQENIIEKIQNNIGKISHNIDIFTRNKINLEQQHKEALEAAEMLKKRLEKALQEGNESLASELLSNHQRYADTAIDLKTQLDELANKIYSLQRELRTNEHKLIAAELELSQIKTVEDEGKQTQILRRTKYKNNVSRAARYILNFIAGRTRDTALLQEQLVIDINEELQILGRELARAIESEKYFQKEYEKFKIQANQSQQQAKSFLQIGDEQQASDALSQQQYYSDIALDWKTKLDEQTIKVDSLKQNLSDKQQILSLARTERDIVKLRKK